MGFEPTRAEHIGLAVQRLNHSATVSTDMFDIFAEQFPKVRLEIPITTKIQTENFSVKNWQLSENLKKISNSKKLQNFFRKK